MNDPNESPPSSPTENLSASDELREGLNHLFAAARKAAHGVEPHVSRTIEEAERAIERVGHEGEVLASDVTREVATFATRLAEKLRAVADRNDASPPPDAPKP